MGGPASLTYIFAAMMLTVAVYCAGRLVAARRWRRSTDLDTDMVHVVMGMAMAGMLVAGLRILPARMWEAVFAAAIAWFGWQFLRVRRGGPAGEGRCPQPAPHLVECGAMLYMFLALSPVKSRSGMNGMTASLAGSHFALVAFGLAVFMIGNVVRVADGLAVPTRGHLAPRCAAMCKIAMGVTMGYLLIMMR